MPKKNTKKTRYNIVVKPGSTKENKTGPWKIFFPITDHSKCIGCGRCALFCPDGILHQTTIKTKNGKFVYEKDLDYCKGCGLCAAECPVKCIEMKMEDK